LASAKRLKTKHLCAGTRLANRDPDRIWELALKTPFLTSLTATTLLATLLCACSPYEFSGDEPGSPGAWGKADGIPAELEFATKVRVGDIILTSSGDGSSCWYLNKLQNWATKPRFCHAALVVERYGEVGFSTIEGLNESQGIQVITDAHEWLGNDPILAVLRVVDDDNEPLADEAIQEVVKTAMGWLDVEYIDPPISLHGDPHETGLYCSMLPYRAYLDATGVDLDAFSIYRTIMVPFFVTPDELYESPNSRVIYEKPSPEEPKPEEPNSEEPNPEDPAPPEEPDPEEPGPEEPPPPEDPTPDDPCPECWT
jgi:hypothetical protein